MATTKKTEQAHKANAKADVATEAQARGVQEAATTYLQEVDAFKAMFNDFYHATKHLKDLARKEGRPDAVRLFKLEKALLRNSRYAEIDITRQALEHND